MQCWCKFGDTMAAQILVIASMDKPDFLEVWDKMDKMTLKIMVNDPNF